MIPTVNKILTNIATTSRFLATGTLFESAIATLDDRLDKSIVRTADDIIDKILVGNA
jgi:hypothetical protein